MNAGSAWFSLPIVFVTAWFAGCIGPGLAETPSATPPPLVLLVAGEPSHGPGEHRFPEGCALLADALNRSGLPLRAEVSRGWPAETTLARAATLVIYSDGLDAHVAAKNFAALRRHVDARRGLAVIHFALEPAPGELADLWLEKLGGRFEENFSVNPIWKPQAQLATHPITRGVASLEVEDEWYFHLRFGPEITPLVQAVPPLDVLGSSDGPRSGNAAVRRAIAARAPQTLAWCREDDGWRAFGFTGAHFHRNWSDDAFRTLALNAIVWTAGLDVPAEGIRSALPITPRYATIDEAIARGDVADVRRHLALDPQRVHRGKNPALAPLHQAILRNHAEIARELVEAGANVDQPDGGQRTPLHLAVERNNAELVAFLLAKKARPNEHDRIGWTPLHHAAAKDRVAVARALIDGGADVKTLSARGGTALHEAAASGGAEMIERLLAAGVDPRVVSQTGVTALDLAREYGNAAALERLSAILK
jgi:hypothetical protein